MAGAEPARQLGEEAVPGNVPSAPPGPPELKALEGGGETSDPDTSWYKPENQPPSSQELSTGEKGAGSQHERQIGQGFSKAPSKGMRSRLAGLSGRKKIAFGVGGGAGIVGIILGLFLSSLPFQLINFKHAVTDNIGGVQSRVYRIGRTKMYSTMFFFDENRNYTGAKVGGVRRLMMENRQTKQMVQNLKDNGYKISFDQTTGKVQSLKKIDANGKVVESYDSNSRLKSAWAIKDSGVLNNILSEVYPDKSDFWYSSATRKLYRRWNLTRTDWLKENFDKVTGKTALKALELKFKESLRQKLFGTGVSVNGAQVPNSKATTPAEVNAQQVTLGNDNLMQNAATAGSADEQKMSADPSYNPSTNFNATSAVENAASGAAIEKATAKAAESTATSALGSISVLNADQNLCMANSALNDVVTGARVLRSAQLMKFALSVLTVADAVQNGKHVNAAEVQAMMMYLNSTDKNGHNMFASSGWQYWVGAKAGTASMNKYDKNELNNYSVGGGFTGVLANIRNLIDNKLGGGSNCGFVNNPFVSIGGMVVGVGAGILTGGGFSAVDVAFNVGASFAVNFAIAVSEQMFTPMVAGTVINGAEQGTEVGNALVSGAEVLTSANGASAGMRPLTNGEFKVAEAAVKNDQKVELAKMSLKDRLFSLNNEGTLASTALNRFSGISLSGTIGNMFSSISGIFNFSRIGGLFSHVGLAADMSADGGGGCNDPDITKNHLASTPFCNEIMGLTDAELNDPAYQPETIDDTINLPQYTDGSHLNADDNGNPIPDSLYDNYLKHCSANSDFGAVDIIHKNEDQNNAGYTSRCTDTPVFNMYAFWMNLAQSENDGLTGNITDNSTSGNTSTTTTPATVSAAPLTSLNGHQLSATQTKWVKYIADNVVQLLPGSSSDQAAMAARVTWWNLKEGVLSLDNPFAYSNCHSGGVDHRIAITTTCPSGGAWQVGIAGVQPPNFSLSEVETVAKARHPGMSLKDILAQVAASAGYSVGSADYNTVVNSSGDLLKSLLLQDPATGFTFVDRNIQSGCINQWLSWCAGADFATNQQVAKSVIAELTTYFVTSLNTAQAAGSIAPSGDSQQLAKQILANNNIQLAGRDVLQDIQAAANNQSGTAGVKTSSAILRLILATGKSHKVLISAIQSGGTGHCSKTPKSACPTDHHYTGDAVDFAMLDQTSLTGRDAASDTVANLAMQILPSGSAFGQSQCSGTPLTLKSGFSEFSDTCNHLHVQVPANTP